MDTFVCGKCGKEKSKSVAFGTLCGVCYVKRHRGEDSPKGKNGKPKKQTSLESLYKSYEGGAKRRGIPFRLTLVEFKAYISRPCTYCNSDSHKIGIDRIDNSIGYLSSNCVSCCWNCNRMKGTLTYTEFVSHAIKIVEHAISGKALFIGTPVDDPLDGSDED